MMVPPVETFEGTFHATEVCRLYLGRGARDLLLQDLLNRSTPVLCISHPTIVNAHPDFFAALKEHASISLLALPEGEHTKSWSALEGLLEAMFQAGLKRDGLLVVIGGGVLGDVGGLAGAIYMRGIEVWQVPTTLLALVDSAIGGKTAIDTSWGKNLVGVVRQPARIYSDPVWLSTLPVTEWRNGLGEIAKYGVILGDPYFAWLEDNLLSNGRRDPHFLDALIRPCIRCKWTIVQADPHDTGKRRILNLGHTIGHALERLADFRLPHGTAVLLGILAETAIAQTYRLITDDDVSRIHKLVRALLPRSMSIPWDTNRFMTAIQFDKKQSSASPGLTMALPFRPGDVRVYDEVKPDDVLRVMEALIDSGILEVTARGRGEATDHG